MPAYFFDAKTLGFIIVESSDEVTPKGTVEVSPADYDALVRVGQMAGKRIAADKAGRPMLVDPPPATIETLEKNERWWRDAQLAQSDGMVSRHRDELEEGSATTLTAEQYAELQRYRRSLRDWPQGTDFPQNAHRPAAPQWLADLIQ